MDVFTTQERSRVMAAIKSNGNRSTEMRLIILFRELGVKGWRRRKLQKHGCPDFVFPALRIAVFVDGCFWHGCPIHGRRPSSNSDYWTQKIERNMRRDRAVVRDLKRANWKVLRIWEHELTRRNGPSIRVKLRRHLMHAIKQRQS